MVVDIEALEKRLANTEALVVMLFGLIGKEMPQHIHEEIEQIACHYFTANIGLGGMGNPEESGFKGFQK